MECANDATTWKGGKRGKRNEQRKHQHTRLVRDKICQGKRFCMRRIPICMLWSRETRIVWCGYRPGSVSCE